MKEGKERGGWKVKTGGEGKEIYKRRKEEGKRVRIKEQRNGKKTS